MNKKKHQFQQTELDDLIHHNFNEDGIIIYRFFSKPYHHNSLGVFHYIDDIGFDFDKFRGADYFEINAWYGISQDYIDSKKAEYPNYKIFIQEALEPLIPEFVLCSKCWGDGCRACDYDGVYDANLIEPMGDN